MLHAYPVAILGFLISNLVVKNDFKLIKYFKNVSNAEQRSILPGSRTYFDDVMIHLKDMLNKYSITLNKPV